MQNNKKREDLQSYILATMLVISFCIPIVDSVIGMIKHAKTTVSQKTNTHNKNQADTISCCKCFFEKQR